MGVDGEGPESSPGQQKKTQIGGPSSVTEDGAGRLSTPAERQGCL